MIKSRTASLRKGDGAGTLVRPNLSGLRHRRMASYRINRQRSHAE